MQEIDVDGIIKGAGLEVTYVAKQLFPTNKLPMPALQRVIDGAGLLDSNQLSKLAVMVGCTESELYTVAGWKAKTIRGPQNVFTKGDYVAELCTSTNLTKIYHKGSMFHESVLHNGGIALSEYIIILNNIINKHQKG